MGNWAMTGAWRWVLLVLAGLALTGSQSRQQAYDSLAQNMGVRYEIVDNLPAHCPQDIADCFLTRVTLTMPASLPADISAENFAIYFSFVNPLPVVQSDIFEDHWINGDLHRLTLKPGARLEAGKSYDLQLWGLGAHHSVAFVMPNFYLVANGINARTIAATVPRIDPETGRETLPFVVPMVDEARLARSSAEDATVWQTPQRAYDTFAARGSAETPEIAILPSPRFAHLSDGQPLDLSGGVRLALHGVARADIDAALHALARAGVNSQRFFGGPTLDISVSANASLPPESYRLNIAANGVRIIAADVAGANHALQSLAQQALYSGTHMRPMEIEDGPRYSFRGLHIDLARNFHSKAEILKLLDAMAAYKLNKLHLHLADDEGWRIEIKALPELVRVGAKRCHDPNEQRCLLPQLGAGTNGTDPVTGPINGYLSQDDYVAIVRAAKARQIEVIPSLDMPGHSRAAIRSMEARYHRLMAAGQRAQAGEYRLVEPADRTQYRSIQNYTDNTLNVCLDSTYHFLDTAVDEIAAMHRRAGAPLAIFHIGADETAGAWTASPSCAPILARVNGNPHGMSAYFIERVAAMLAAKGLKVAGWSDGLGHTNPANMPPRVQTNIWGGLFTGGVEEAHRQANLGWDVVLSMPDWTYFDMPYVPHPLEGGYDWATRSVDTFQVFAFMSDNLAANGALMTDRNGQAQTVADGAPLQYGRAIAGIQAQLWSETTRTDAGVDYQLFPRLIALAERAWHWPSWEMPYQAGRSYRYGDSAIDGPAILADWQRFAGRMPTQFRLLDSLAIAYRITPPGAKVEAGIFYANSEYPGQIIQYRQANGPWQQYSEPVALSGPATGPIMARTLSADGKRASRSVSVPN